MAGATSDPVASKSPSLIAGAAPPVGVGLPVYNGEPYLAASLRSLLGQSDADFELVIADNCSTDGTEEICREAARADQRVRYLRRDRNIGVVANHNQVVHETRGEFFSWAASDDEYRPDRLAKLSDALRTHPDASVAISAAEEIDETGRVLSLWRNTIRTDHADPAVRMRAKLADPDENLQMYGLIRRSALLRTGLHAQIKGSDRILIVELALNGHFVVVDEPLLRHRNHTRRNSEVTDSRSFRVSEGQRRRITLPNVEEGGLLLRAVRNAPLRGRDRLRAYRALSPWLRRNAVPMARNVARAGIESARGIGQSKGP
ncbi:glycosyltransferase family 2 protein [Solihabitans fulvus]|uniref:Glycosyltransferase family 2 protein n=1 Tax=Solihabitans fulvus TaxID=1892852 RepID=A0A5B2XDJ8_9PSEU|nr:glycosyltransferase family 2 protein [Solihabitans fulvus]KAA2261175.1 glycosyltransferase family 2 protein [Solihabitans fulvus]